MRTEVIICLISLILVGRTSADENKNAIKLYMENDLGSSDQGYTHGTRLEWQSLNYKTPIQVDQILSDYLFWQDRGYTKRSWYLNQNIYTPKDIKSEQLILDDRPYAGWLYIGYSIEESGKTVSDAFEVQAGVVGPWAFSGETQTLVHKIAKSTKPNGWDNQLNNEPALNILRKRAYKIGIFDTEWIDADVVNKNAICLGNVFTYIESGLMFRTGKNLPDSFGDNFMSPRKVDDSPWFDIKWSNIFLFSGINGRVVGGNIFLDGNTFSDSHSVDKEWVVGEFYYGIALKLRWFDFMFSSTTRSKEFETEEHGHEFKSLSLTVYY